MAELPSQIRRMGGGISQLLEQIYGFSRRCLFRVISMGPLPRHLAFIMDGNRRYAKKLGLEEGSGHKAGLSALMSMLQYCYELGIKYVTIYAFSIDNFRRQPEEVQSLMDLMLVKIKSLLEKESIVHQYGIRVYFIGNLALLNDQVRAAAEKVMMVTAKNSRVVLLVCIAYNSTDEIVQAVKKSCINKSDNIEASGNYTHEDIDSDIEDIEQEKKIHLLEIEENMQMSVVPDPDILIRSSGETRLSNFLLWQTELEKSVDQIVACSSILLLMKFKLLHVLLPFQAAYLDQAAKTSMSSALMLLRLFSSMDKLVSCDQPADPKLWIAVLAFHIALVRNPQEAIVVRAFAALLYHRNWSKAVEFAREHENSVLGFTPEVSKSSRKRSDEDLAEAVSEFICLLKDTQYVLTGFEALREALYLYPDFKFSGLVFIPKKKGGEVAEGFARMSDVESYESKKEGFSIDYVLLGKGNPCEVRFVLGKIILDTITKGIDIEQLNSVTKKQSTNNQFVPATYIGKDGLVISTIPSKEDNNSQAHGSNASSVLKILKRTREDSGHKNDQETEVCLRTLSGPAENQDQSVVQKLKKRRSKEASVSELPKQKTSKRSRSDGKEAVGSLSVPAKNQDQSSKRRTNAPICEPPPKQKTSKNRSKETQKVKHKDLPVKEIQEAKHDFVSDKSMSDLLKVLEKSGQQVSSKDESDSLSLEKKTKKPKSLSSLFR